MFGFGRGFHSQNISMTGLILALALVAEVPVHGAPAAPAPAPASLKATLDSLVAAESRVRWEPLSPDSAIARAARQGRPAFLDFFADWCVPCR